MAAADHPNLPCTTSRHPQSSKPPNITSISLFFKLKVSNLNFISLDLFILIFVYVDLSLIMFFGWNQELIVD